MQNTWANILLNIRLLVRKIDFQKLSVFSLIFFFAKGMVFLAPLTLSNVLNDTSKYGSIEYIINLGSILVNFIAIGLHAAYPYFNLRLQKQGYQSVFYFHALLVSVFLFTIGCLCLAINLVKFEILLSVLVGLILTLQLIFSSIQKSHNQIIKAVILDGGIYLVLLLLAVYLTLFKIEYTYLLLLIFLLIYLSFLLLIYIKKFRETKNDFSIKRYKEVLHFGLPLIISAFTTAALLGSTRVYIEYFLTIKDVGYFSFYFRLAALIVMIHQVVNIAFFKKIYQATPTILDKYFSLFIGGIAACSLLLFIVVPIVAMPYFIMIKESINQMRPLYFILSIQVIFWIGNALNENIITRENLASTCNKWFIGILVLMLSGMYFVKILGWLNLFTLTIINLLAIFSANEVQFFLLKKYRKAYFPKTRIVNYAVLCTFFILYLLFKH